MKIAIIGTGGVGGYFGGKLAIAGNDVTFFARGEHLNAIRKNGLTVKSINGDFTIANAKATDTIERIGVCDLIILCVKAWQVKEIAPKLLPIIDKETMILPMQNGVLAADELKTAINPHNIIGGLCRIISKIESPGVINHLGVEPTVVFGELDNTKTPRIQRIKELFDAAKVNAQIANDIHAELWKKFISICVGGLLAVTRSTYGELREMKETRELTIQLLTEIYNLSRKAKINVGADYVQKAIAFIDTLPYESTASLTRDVWEGRPSEIEYQNGSVVKLAEQHGVDTPVNRFVYYSLLPMEKRARKQVVS